MRKQFFSPDILGRATREKPFATTVKLDAAARKTAKREFLRLVLEDVSPGEGKVVVAGKQLPLPCVLQADNVPGIVNLPLDAASLSDETKVEFLVAASHAGYRVDMVSIVLEQRDE